MNRLLLILILAAGPMAASCTALRPETFTDRADVSSPLLGSLPSYATVDDIRQRHGSGAWTVVGNSHLPTGDPRPRFDMVRVSIPGYVHLGHRGDLELTFFNDRLSSAWFYPDDDRGYLAALARDGVEVAESDWETEPAVVVAPYTRVWTTRDFRGRVYVGWDDSRLVEQQRRWIERYS